MSAAICTLFEGHYHIGAAALINSAWASGFRGRFICGLRGELPPWARPATRDGASSVMSLGEGFEIVFVSLNTDIHFTNYKPTFLREMWKGPASGAEKFFYLDPDIVIKCPWAVLERWSNGGIALCEDVNYYLPARHPLRIGWIEWLRTQGMAPVRTTLDRYYSGGFIGLEGAHAGYLGLWEELIAKIGAELGSLSALKSGNATSLFHSMDQDAMNLALMLTDAPINGAGWEAMDFAHGGHLLSHAIGSRKPWRGHFVSQALHGYPPSLAAKAFFDHVDGPIECFGAGEKRKLRRNLKIASVLGRFYRRT